MHPPEPSPLDLLRRGNILSFEKLFNENYAVLCLYARKIVGDMDLARDIVQDIFVTIYSNRSTLEIETSIRSYLFKSVHNACLNHLTKTRIHSHHHELIKYQLPFADNHDTMVKAELEEKIAATIQGLPDQCRRIFEMNRFEGKKNGEIAKALNISVRTVETQISKALRILRERLLPYLPTLLMLFAAA